MTEESESLLSTIAISNIVINCIDMDTKIEYFTIDNL